ncbi:MAG: peptidylprolyl isomerase [Patescibacteria group bacterium]|mgnify:CR=1 FL=1
MKSKFLVILTLLFTLTACGKISNEEKAINLVQELPEVKEWMATPDLNAVFKLISDEDGIYVIQAYEDFPDHTATFNFYDVNLETGSIIAEFPDVQEESTESITNEPMQTKPKAGDTIATISTTKGEIKMLVYAKEAPETAKNFIELSKKGEYDGVVFHRVIEDFMIQTGDFENGNGTGGYTYKGPGTYLEDEFGKGLKHLRGAVSMANAGADTGGSQFFIVQKEDGTSWLDGKHAIFGYVYEGMDVVDAIAGAEADQFDKPLKTIKMEKIKISKFK